MFVENERREETFAIEFAGSILNVVQSRSDGRFNRLYAYVFSTYRLIQPSMVCTLDKHKQSFMVCTFDIQPFKV